MARISRDRRGNGARCRGRWSPSFGAASVRHGSRRGDRGRAHRRGLAQSACPIDRERRVSRRAARALHGREHTDQAARSRRRCARDVRRALDRESGRLPCESRHAAVNRFPAVHRARDVAQVLALGARRSRAAVELRRAAVAPRPSRRCASWAPPGAGHARRRRAGRCAVNSSRQTESRRISLKMLMKNRDLHGAGSRPGARRSAKGQTY